ncbi:MAG: OB-fold nucleic acid binding domain-containing protein [Hadesarchaea archaeon]|nr:OB-fold nucleic acid binding domain-containing protein [Hadesarchaea archaeon]
MDDKTVARLSLICSLTGLAAIYVAAASVRPRVTPIASLDNEFVGLKVAISGQVIDYREHQDGHIFLKLRDDSGGVVSVPIFSRLRAELGESIELLDVVEIVGEVVLYRGELEVVPGRASDVKVVHTAPVKLSSLSVENAGVAVKVQGTITEREIVGGGNFILTLMEDGGQLPVFIPYWIADDGLPELHVGDVVRVDGWLQLYNDKLELKVANASHLHVVEAA